LEQITPQDQDGEISIYYQWTGLGAVYTAGGAKFLNLYKDDPLKIIPDLNPESVSWNNFLKK
jgi:hypothetical protein